MVSATSFSPSSLAEASTLRWKKLLHHCVSKRVDASEFRDFSKLMINRDPIPARKLIDLVLDSRAVTNVEWDPLIPLYVDCLLRLSTLKIPDILSSLLAHSTISANRGKRTSSMHSTARGHPSTLMTEYRILQSLMIALTTGYAPESVGSALNAFTAIADWILTLLAWNPGGISNGDGPENENGQQSEWLMSSPDAITVFESLGVLFAALAGTEHGLNALSAAKEQGSDRKNRLSSALSGYIPLCSGISIPLRDRLVTLQKDFNLYTAGDKALEDTMMGGMNVSALEFESNVVDSPVINSRAGLFIYINALLVGRPLIDNNMLINYLNNRYGGNRMALVEELITAAFDVLSNGMYRNESNRTMFIFRAFLVNKLPPFLAEMSSSLGASVPMDVCITRAFGRIDPNTFPSFSEIFAMQGNSVLSDVRQEFLFSCALHRLIPESSIEQLLGENPMQTLPVGGQYRKDDLVSQINSNPERAELLLDEVEAMEGNAGAIVDAIVEVMHTLCSRKETMTLKGICNALTRRPPSLDVMLLFRSPGYILQPLCALLDVWKWDEEQGEKQPVYDEFGSILLLILAFKYKYELTHNDLGITNPDSFVLRLLEKGYASQKLEDLTEKQTQNLGAWITALYIAEGISDESMSSCSPQEFYLLVATLFSQSLGACESGKLEFETLKGGFEYLLEPFLLPALVMALAWLGNHIWESESDLTISLRLLHALVKPSSISGEAQEIHRTVLMITARTLEEQLKDVRSRHPSRTDIKPILDALESCHSFRRTGATRRAELDTWKANPAGGGLTTSIRNTFSSLVLWSTDPEISMTPPSYTHRQLLAGIGLLGSVRVLQGLIDELKLQAEPGSAEIAVDIAATLICAPLANSFAEEQAIYHNIDPSKAAGGGGPRSSLLTLRDALNLQHESLGKMIETDPYRAELVVRLRRRVEALAALPQISAQEVHNIDNIMDEINLQNVGDEQQQQQQQQTDMQAQGTAPGDMGTADRGNDDAFNEMLGVAVSGSSAEPGSTAAPVTTATDPNQSQMAGMEMGMGMGMGMGAGSSDPAGLMDTADFEDVLNMADMGVGNPEFIDLDMEGMF